MLLALGTLVVSIVWRLPTAADYIAHRTGEILFAFVLAMSLTYLLRPVVNTLCRMRWFGSGNSRAGRMWATVLVFLACIALLVLAISVGSKPVQAAWDSFFDQNSAGRIAMVDKWKLAVEEFFNRYQGLLPDQFIGNIQQNFPEWLIAVKQRGATWVGKSFSHLGFIIELLLVPVLVFYFLTDGPMIRTEAEVAAAHALETGGAAHGGPLRSRVRRFYPRPGHHVYHRVDSRDGAVAFAGHSLCVYFGHHRRTDARHSGGRPHFGWHSTGDCLLYCDALG